MEATNLPVPTRPHFGDWRLTWDPVLKRFSLRPQWIYLATVAATLLFFVVDVFLPRGATAAIGYCLVPVMAVGTRRRGFFFGTAAACTLLTWVGLVVEPPGALRWMSVFDRAMVTVVLWLTLLLVWQRAIAGMALAHQTRALEDATLELTRSNRELESFASVIAHDVRSPLNGVGLITQLLARHPLIRSDAECGGWIGSIQSELASMNRLIGSLLSYGRVGSGQVRWSDCDTEAVLANVRQALVTDLRDATGAVTNDPLPVVRADPVLMGELFQNLIQNSLKYRGDVAPRVHVSAAPQADGWRFSVKDNGIGVSSGDLTRIFEPFCQGRSSGNGRGGVGLGLATCKRIVERHGGRIEVQSSPRQGATFFFTIPQQPDRRQTSNPF
jgi:signal transduction histidine kinase